MMVRPPHSPETIARGRQVGAFLRQARGDQSIVDVAARAHISAETLRKIETGRLPTPSFETIAAVAAALQLSLDDIAAARHAATAVASTSTRMSG